MKNALNFTYQLSYNEIYEAFFLLSMKWNKKTRMAIAVILTAIAVCFLVMYALNSKNIYYFFFAIIDIFLLYYLIYMPALKARHGAQKVCKQHGIYKVQLTESGRILSGNENLAIAGDANARAIETKTSYIIRPDAQHTFCIPKRIMSITEQEQVQFILMSSCKYTKDL